MSTPISRRLSRLLTGFALSVATLWGAGVVAVPAHAEMPVTAPVQAAATTSAVVSLSLSGGGLVSEQAVSTSALTVRNSGTAALEPGQIEVRYGREPLTTQSSIVTWTESSRPLRRSDFVGSVEVPALAPGESVTVTGPSFDAEALGLPLLLDRLANYPVDVNYTSGSHTQSTHSTFVWQPAEPTVDMPLGVVVPIVLPPSPVGTIPAEVLDEETSPFGSLSRQLDAVQDRAVILALDPRIIASIRVLGTEAPESATAWLERLAARPQETIPLNFADADPAWAAEAARAAGSPLDAPLAPSSLEYARIEAVTEPTPDPSPEESTGTDEGTPTAAAADAPTGLDELLAWPYSHPEVLWAASGLVTPADIPVFAGSGESARLPLLASNNLSADTDGRLSTRARVADADVLVLDRPLSGALGDHLAAATSPERDAAQARWTQRLVAQASETSLTTRGALLELPRDWARNADALGPTLDALLTVPGARPGALADALAADAVERTAEPSGDVTTPASADSALITEASAIDAFSSALGSGAELLAGRERAQLLALFSRGWSLPGAGRPAAVAEHRAQTRSTLDAVSVVTTTQFNMISGQASLPFAVRNDLPWPIETTLRIRPSNPRLEVGSTVPVTISAHSRETVRVPVESRLGNGSVSLELQLLSATGVLIGPPQSVPVNVRADWESTGAIVFGSAVVLLLVAGVWRTIRRRRDRSGTSDNSRSVDEEATAPSLTDPSKEQDV